MSESQTGRTILVVDDDPAMRSLLRDVLTRASFTVEAATSGEEGLKLSRTSKPDLVLLDINLPGMDGIEVLRQLRSDAATNALPVILLTGNILEVDRVIEVLDLDPADFITKTISPKELIARIHWVFRKTAHL